MFNWSIGVMGGQGPLLSFVGDSVYTIGEGEGKNRKLRKGVIT